MKKTLWRVSALCLALMMLMTCLASCKKDDTGKDGGDKTPTGNDPYSSVVENGTEEELTAVREDLIKYTEIEGFGEIDKMELYENGSRTASSEYWQVKDNKKIYYSGDKMRVVNYPDGYIIDLPADWKPDYSLGTLRVRYDTDEVSLIASREDVGPDYHGGMQEYFDALYLFVGNEDYHKNNRVTVVEDFKTIDIDDEWKARIYRLKLDDCPEGIKCYYTYVDYYNDLNNTYHFMFKAVDDRDFTDIIMSFKSIYDKGAAVDTVLYPQENNPHWNEETKAYYEALCKQEHIDWGLFAYRLQTTGWKVTIPRLESVFDYKFPIISEYVHYTGEFPNAFADKVTKDGDRMMQISYQYTLNNNGDKTFTNPMLDIYRGEGDEVLTAFAEGAAEFGQPFFFRLNNEMNTDWTSYCGMANMLDRDIFIDTWIRLYDIFTETGANQYAMWIFNGFDNSYPPYNWCDYRCYMPQANYIDLIGLTGYNFGTAAEGTWKSFQTIYDKIYTEYSQHFADWPWIISEFGCESAEDASKAEWITEMFDHLATNPYPQLKVAIWFNCSDYDAEGNVTNDINLEKDPEVMQAFKEGLEKTQP